MPDSVWIDLGDPIQELEDGTRYKPLYAFLVIDLDSRLNVNAHGLADHINPPRSCDLVDNNGDGLSMSSTSSQPDRDYAPTTATNLTQGEAGDQLSHADRHFRRRHAAHGIGYGPAEISLRPLLPRPWADVNGTPVNAVNCSEVGQGIDAITRQLCHAALGTRTARRHGRLRQVWLLATAQRINRHNRQTLALASATELPVRAMNAGTPTGEQAIPDLSARLKFFDYPWAITQLSAFGSPPDLICSLCVGLDYIGQPTYEVLRDRNAWDNTLGPPAAD